MQKKNYFIYLFLFYLLLLQTLTDTIVQLRTTHSVTIAKIAEHKRKQIELNHRVLKVMDVSVISCN